MSDFLSRLAGQTMGLALSVQPMVAPMYAHRSIYASEQPGLAPFNGDLNAPVEREPLPASVARDTRRAPILPHNSWIEQADPHQELASVQGEYADQTPENHLLSDEGSAGSSPFERGSPLQSISLEGGVRKDGDYKNVQSVQYSHTLSVDEPSQSLMSSSGSLSVQDNSHSQRASAHQLFAQSRGDGSPRQQGMPLTGDTPVVHRQPPANDVRRERRQIGNVPDGIESELEEERTPPQDWALPTQKVPGTQVSHPVGYDSLKRGNFGGTTHQMGQDEALPVVATAPSIQVTIGRIEVRATPPVPTRSPAQRTAPSVMSLDDYVNQRMKGGR